MNKTGYIFYLANESDLSLIGQFTQARGRNLDIALNKNGSVKFTVSMDDPLASQIVELTTAIVVKLAGKTIFSGKVWTTDHQLPQRTVDVTALGWYDNLKRRVLRDNNFTRPLDVGMQDPSFENYVGPNGPSQLFTNVLADWPLVFAQKGNITLSSDFTNLVGGPGDPVGFKALKIVNNYVAPPPPPARTTYNVVTFSSSQGGNPLWANNLLKDFPYVFSFWYMRNDTGTSGFLGALITLTVTDQNGTVTTTTTSTSADDQAGATPGVWYNQQLQFVVPDAGLAFVNLSITMFQGATWEIDDFRILSQVGVFVNEDAGSIVSQMVNYANSFHDTRITMGNIDVSQPRIVTYRPFQKIADIIDQLSAVEAGFDWDIDPVTRKLNIFYRQFASGISVFGKGRDKRQDVVFGYNWGPCNCKDVKKSVDPSWLLNNPFIQGKFSGSFGAVNPTPTPGDAQSLSIAKYGLYEDAIQLSDVADNTILEAYAEEEIALRSVPRVIYQFTPLTVSAEDMESLPDDTPNVPRAFIDYEVGDIITFGCMDGTIQVANLAQRIYGMNVTIDDNGNELSATLQTNL